MNEGMERHGLRTGREGRGRDCESWGISFPIGCPLIILSLPPIYMTNLYM